VLHPVGNLHVLDLDDRDLDPPRLRLLVDDLLEALVEPLALGQQGVELRLAQDGSQGGLGDLEGCADEVLDLEHRAPGIDHAEVDDRRDLHRHVVARYHVLVRDPERDRA
jgi:hypothetical protein